MEQTKQRGRESEHSHDDSAVQRHPTVGRDRDYQGRQTAATREPLEEVH
jgi:hypothetical protein